MATNKKQVEDTNKALGDQINMIAALADMMKDVVSQARVKGELDKGSVDLTRQTLKATRDLLAEYDSLEAVQKDITKQQQQQAKNNVQIQALSKNLNDTEKKALETFKKKNQESQKAENLAKSLADKQKRGLKVSDDQVKRAQELADKKAEQVAQAGSLLSNQAEQIAFLEQTNTEVEANLELLAEQERRQQNLVKSGSLITDSFGAASKILNKMGATKLGSIFSEASGYAKKLTKEMTDGGNRTLTGFEKMKVGVKSLGKALSAALSPMNIILGVVGLLVSQFKKFKQETKEAQQYLATVSGEMKDFGKSLGVSAGTASRLYGQMNSIGKSMGMTRQEATGAGKEIYSTLGGVEQLSNNTAKAFLKLSAHGGVAADTLKEMHTMAKLTGEDAGDVAQNVALTAQNQIKSLKLNVSMKNIMKAVAGVSNNVKLAMGGSAEAITKAVTKAKKLGLEMKDVEGIASSLLNIEDSLAAEMEAELLTGKELNLEKARAAALNNDQVGLMEALAEQGITQADYAGMNVLQQEALAKSLGMNRDQMSDMLVKQKENNAENMNQVDMQKQGIEAMTTMASLADKLANQEERRLQAQTGGVEELTRFEEAMLKLKEAAQPILDAIFVPIMNTIASIAEYMADLITRLTEGGGQLSFWEKTVGAILIALGTIAGIYKTVQLYNKGIAMWKEIQLGLAIAQGTAEEGTKASILAQTAGIIANIGKKTVELGIQMGILSASLATNAAVTFGVGVAIAVAAATAGYFAIKALTGGGSSTEGAPSSLMGDDVFSEGGYGKRTLLGPEGAIRLNDKDDIVAGTDLFNKSEGKGGGMNDAKLDRIANLLERILSKEGGVYIDGNKVGATIALTNYEQQ